jgi:hypothetical protein
MQKYSPLFDAAVRRRNSLPPKSKAARRAQQEVSKYYHLMYSEGYFRDSYNPTNLLNLLGFSWWADVKALCTKDRKLRGARLRTFRDMVVKAELKLPSKEDLVERGAIVRESGPNSLDEWHKYFVAKRTALLAFLDQAIELDSAIHCSL